VLHHLAKCLPEHRNTVVITDDQVLGTRGASLPGGASEQRIHGHGIAVRGELVQPTPSSAHADSNQLIG
jgi:metallo-beta-lactamase family protein